MTEHAPIIAALRSSLERDPKQPEVWSHLADLLVADGDATAAIDALRNAERVGADPEKVMPRLVRLLRERGDLAEALIRLEEALEGTRSAVLIAELSRVLLARGDAEEALARYREAVAIDEGLRDAELEAQLAGGAAGASPGEIEGPTESRGAAEDSRAEGASDPDERPAPLPVEPAPVDGVEDLGQWASQFDWGDLHVTFEDVVGLDAVKKQIRLRVIAPRDQGHLLRAFGRRGGGGILLYGPPGCGKTYIARATAGEVNARFISVGIHEVLDKYYGESEKMIHSLFEEARRNTPCVLFFDEFDAFAAGRRAQSSPYYQTVVDQLLQEMDGMMGNNEDVLVFAATNVPWHIDAAFRRPGRFDRTFFLPPPDRKARLEYLGRRCAELPGGSEVPLEHIARETDLFTFADLRSLCERASERALEGSLESGSVQPVTGDDFIAELPRMHETASEWLATARNYARYANEGGQYDELARFLRKKRRG